MRILVKAKRFCTDNKSLVKLSITPLLFKNLYRLIYLVLKTRPPQSSQTFCKNNAFWWKFELALLSRAEVFEKSKAVLTKSLENSDYPGYHEVSISQKYGRFYEVNWKFALPLLWLGKIFPKIKQFCWCDLKICTALIIKSWSFCKK